MQISENKSDVPILYNIAENSKGIYHFCRKDSLDIYKEVRELSVHEGHRQRLKDRFLLEGLDGFTEFQILELLLFYVIPQKDTNPIAHALLERFGSLAKVLDAPMAKLMEVEGIKKNAATYLRLMSAVSRSDAISRSKEETRLPSVAACGAYLKPFFKGRRNETVFLLSLDAKLKVLSCRQVGEGSINYASVPIRRVVEMAIEDGATTVVLAHNHPSGIAIPSEDDIETTRRLAAALHTMEICLFDHIVVADDDYVSMAESRIRFDDYFIY